MTALEMATEFVNTMNPERKTDGSANFGIMEFPFPQDGVHLEVCFIEEDFPDEKKYKTAIDVVGDTGEGTGIYTCADTMTDIEAIAGGIAYVTEQASMYYDSINTYEELVETVKTHIKAYKMAMEKKAKK